MSQDFDSDRSTLQAAGTDHSPSANPLPYMGWRRFYGGRRSIIGWAHVTFAAKQEERMTDRLSGRVLVPGASGFVGSAVARIARERGFEVRVVVRKTSSRQNIEALDAEVVIGDMRDQA